jgi:hypothetical protein
VFVVSRCLWALVCVYGIGICLLGLAISGVRPDPTVRVTMRRNLFVGLFTGVATMVFVVIGSIPAAAVAQVVPSLVAVPWLASHTDAPDWTQKLANIAGALVVAVAAVLINPWLAVLGAILALWHSPTWLLPLRRVALSKPARSAFLAAAADGCATGGG